MPNRETESLARRQGELLIKTQKEVDRIQRKRCDQGRKNQKNKQHKTAIKSQEGVLDFSFVCAKGNTGRLNTYVVEVRIDQQAKEELSCRWDKKGGDANNSYKIRKCVLDVSYALPLYSLTETMQAIKANTKGVTSSPNQERLSVHSSTNEPPLKATRKIDDSGRSSVGSTTQEFDINNPDHEVSTNPNTHKFAAKHNNTISGWITPHNRITNNVRSNNTSTLLSGNFTKTVSNGGSQNSIALILGLSTGGLVILVFMAVLFYRLYKKRVRALHDNNQNVEGSMGSSLVTFRADNRIDNGGEETEDNKPLHEDEGIPTNINNCISVQLKDTGFSEPSKKM